MEKQAIKVTARCPIRTTLELVGGKWKLLILFQLTREPMRPSALRRQIPDISEKMLVQELRMLMDSGLVARQELDEAPHKVAYCVTEKGAKVLPLIAAMRDFARAYEQH